MNYDDWKTATPPEYDDGPDPLAELFREMETLTSAQIHAELDVLSTKYPELEERIRNVRRSIS